MEIAQIIANRAESQIICCDVADNVRETVAMLAKKRIGAVPVMEHGKVAGIFSERDVLYRLASDGADFLDKKVGDVMTAPAITVAPKTQAIDALGLMTRRRIRHLPVVEADVMRGFVSIGDLVKSRIDEIEQEAEVMREYIQTA